MKKYLSTLILALFVGSFSFVNAYGWGNVIVNINNESENSYKPKLGGGGKPGIEVEVDRPQNGCGKVYCYPNCLQSKPSLPINKTTTFKIKAFGCKGGDAGVTYKGQIKINFGLCAINYKFSNLFFQGNNQIGSGDFSFSDTGKCPPTTHSVNYMNSGDVTIDLTIKSK